MRTFFPEAFHFDHPFLKLEFSSRRYISDAFLPVAITNNDEIVAVSNISLNAFVFGADGREIIRFDVGDAAFRAALLKRFEESVKKNPRGGILPFTLFLSPDRRLYLFTFNATRKAFDALVYSLDGRQEAVLRIPAGISMPFAVNARGEVFGVKEQTIIVRLIRPS